MTRFQLAHVHIGIHKTGTTAFQNAMAELRGDLAAECGILYPSVARNHSVALYSLFSGSPETYKQNIRRGIFTRPAARKQNRRFRRQFEHDFAGPETRLVISGEDLSSLKAPGVERFRDWLAGYADEVRIVCYARNPAEWASSYADQIIKGGATLDDLRRRPPAMNLRSRVTPWISSFGRGNVTMRAYEAARRHPHGLIGDLADIVGVPERLYGRVSQMRLNERMSAEAILLLSALNVVRPKFVKGRIGPSRHADDQSGFAAIRGTRFALDDATIARTLEQSVGDLDWLRSEFGIELETEIPPREEAAPFSSPETLASLALLIAGQAEEARAASDRPRWAGLDRLRQFLGARRNAARSRT